MKTICYEGDTYPAFQAEGNAAQFVMPFAKHICSGQGYDIGCKKAEWGLPGSIHIDLDFDDEWEAMNLPKTSVDYIFSSHCLEHIPNYVDVLEYWKTCLRTGGHVFLYLPDYSQKYWRPWNNKKHFHAFTAEMMKDCLEGVGYTNIIISGIDLNNSFIAIGEKC